MYRRQHEVFDRLKKQNKTKQGCSALYLQRTPILLSFNMLSLLYLGVKVQNCFFLARVAVSLDKKTLLKSWLNPGLQLTIFRGTGPWF